jgi:putative ABC transport system substrate-binding protein
VKGDPKALEETARALEREKVDLIWSLATSVTLAVKRATASVPIVFYAGTDPVVVGLVTSYAKPGGRLTGVQARTTDLTAKRLEILKEMSPKLRRVAAFYDPGNAAARESAKSVREAARQLRIELVERHVRSVEELRVGLQALKAGEVDALAHVSDAMLGSQAKLIVDTAKAKKLMTISIERSFVSEGGLASYGVNFHAVGRQCAKYVHRVLSGTSPAELPVERVDRFELVINLKTAKALGLTIPQSLLQRADEVIQ